MLRPGRPADPGAPESALVPAAEDGQIGKSPQTTTASQDDAPSPQPAEPGPTRAETADEAGDGEADEVERIYAESRQRRYRRLLRQCERVNLMDFNVLSLAGWPDNYTLNAARRRRDSWLLSATIAALVFLSGMTGFVPAWIAGGGFGAFAVILLMGFPPVRRLYSSKPSYLELILYRQQLLREARRHIARLEGEVGLIWQCKELAEFNSALSAPRFSTLKHLSEQRRLAASLTKREHIRLYLIFMLEAEKAYERMQAAYFEGHQQAIDRGWKSVAETITDADKPAPEGPVATPGEPVTQAAGEGEEAGRGGAAADA